MSKVQNLSAKGFTIVETLIVLAIASLILMLVLIAIPTLQRSGRNNRRTQDIQVVLAAVSHYELNHAGTIPSTVQLRAFLNTFERDQLTFYDPANITVATPNATNAPLTYPSVPVADSNILINNHAKCIANGNASNQGAGYSDVVALYNLETRAGVQPMCRQL